MKKIFYLFTLSCAFVATMSLVSCKDELNSTSIFDTNDYPLNQNLYTFPLDTFVKVTYLEPYNMKFIYRMEDVGSDMNYNLIPAAYDKSVDLAVLSKYLWYDIYNMNVLKRDTAGVALDSCIFLKKYSPRIIHLIGSPAYEPAQGVEVLGTAEGGLKITLYNGNGLNPADLDMMNKYFFKTMHHEFSHILHQNINMPTDFAKISNGKYNPIDWSETHDSVALGRGFISPYASSQAREDWVEIISIYITEDTVTWNKLLESAKTQWEYVEDVDVNYWKMIDAKVRSGQANRDTVGYYVKTAAEDTKGNPVLYGIARKSVERHVMQWVHGRDTIDVKVATPDANGNIQYINTQGFVGRDVILEKLGMVKKWLQDNFNYDIDAVRMGVQRRQFLTDANGNFILDAQGNFINNLTYRRTDGTTVMDSLRQQVYKFKK